MGIIYRAWDERNRVMHYDFQFIKSGDSGSDWIVFTSDKQKLSDKSHPFDNPYCSKQLIIMPGITTKALNGVFIYVGDVVLTDEAGWVGAVKFDGDTLWDGDAFWVGGTGSMITQCNWKAFKVLGNIYENPELLKYLAPSAPVKADFIQVGDQPPQEPGVITSTPGPGVSLDLNTGRYTCRVCNNTGVGILGEPCSCGTPIGEPSSYAPPKSPSKVIGTVQTDDKMHAPASLVDENISSDVVERLSRYQPTESLAELADRKGWWITAIGTNPDGTWSVNLGKGCEVDGSSIDWEPFKGTPYSEAESKARQFLCRLPDKGDK